ncbi:MAG: hypothetical protein CME65_02365 [Halobacteriovoraceae bacterium]|nr:hypothetical protein [Halobacteriovoraceae bacterium]|tara:strand:- start:13725 stop:14228 length:504 start_codon:yes stop_codon:yes gene_type:complete
MSSIRERGYYKLSEPDALNLIDIDKYTLKNVEERSRDNGEKDLPEDLTQKLLIFGNYLKTKYIDPNWPQSVFNKFLVWQGVDRDNQGWHTDLFENYDIFFLFYFDDTFPESGGSINFKWDKDKTASFQPKKGDLFLVNNTRGFWHRAESTQILRRTASFDFNTITGI